MLHSRLPPESHSRSNWVGNKRWVQALDWSGKAEFHSAPNYHWVSLQPAWADRPSARLSCFGSFLERVPLNLF